MKRAVKRVELIVNVSVIGAAVLFVSSVGWVALRPSTVRDRTSSIENGTKITLPGWDWSKSPQTLVLVLSADCKYCTASAPFYRRLVSRGGPEAQGTRLLAIFPRATKESREYLASLEVNIDDLQQAVPASVGAKGTPTLILVNASGVVIQSWEGLLPPHAEGEVLASIK